MSLPYDSHEGFGVIVAELATGIGNHMCDSCRIPLKINKKQLASAKRYELPIMDRMCAETYVMKGK